MRKRREANARLYDPVLGRFLSPDPYIQTPDFSQNFNRYTYCLNNPLKYTDESGELFGLDDLIVAGASFAIGYVSHGLGTGNWGMSAVKSGGMLAGTAWLGYNIGGASGGITGKTWSSIGSTAANTLIGQLVPPINIPLGSHYSASLSLGLGFGTQGLTVGANAGINYTNGNFSASLGIGAATNQYGWNTAITYGGYGIGFGQSHYGASEVMGHQFGAQTVGTYTAFFNHNSLSISNDLWGDKEDRWRTSAVELTLGRFSVGTYLYTNWGKRDSKEKVDYTDECVPPWPVGKNKNEGLSTWTNGRVYFAPAWVGYKYGNQVMRIGLSNTIIHNLTQNWVHKGFGKQNYYMSYDDFKSGRYFYSGYHNPFSLWER